MTSHFCTQPSRGRTVLLMSCFSLTALILLTGAAKSRPITKLKYDPNAEVVSLFDGIEQKSLEVNFIAKDSKEGNLFIKNTTDSPLTVDMPKAFAAVHVLKQIGGPGGGGGLNNNNNFGGGGGGGQALGGGIGGGGFGGGGFGGGGGGGFFSVPPEKTARIKIKSVCLEHGKKEPRAKMTYQIKPLEEFTSNVALQELVKGYASSKKKMDFQSVQAAVWHLSNEMSWKDLAQKKYDRIGRPDAPYFTARQLQAAQALVSTAVAKAKELEEENADGDKKAPKRTKNVRTFSSK